MKRHDRLRRWIRREANRLVSRRRYRERKGKKPAASVWSIRVGPAAPRKQPKARKK